VDVGFFVLVIIPERFDDGARLLGGGGVIEIKQRMPMNRLIENGEIRSNSIPICHAGLVHESM